MNKSSIYYLQINRNSTENQFIYRKIYNKCKIFGYPVQKINFYIIDIIDKCQ